MRHPRVFCLLGDGRLEAPLQLAPAGIQLGKGQKTVSKGKDPQRNTND